MEELDSGVHAGPGTFRCAVCRFAVTLHDGDTLPECPGCGGQRFERARLFGATVEVEAPPVEPEPPEWLDDVRERLDAGIHLAFEHDGRVRTVTLPEGWTRIGRSLSADVRLDDPTVSRRHALVHRQGDTVRVLDDRSLNGVFRNGRRVDLELLEDGDAISIGRFELRFLRVAPDRNLVHA